MDINDIPANAKKFSAGVSEHVYDTEAEVVAFVEGVGLADDIDVECGQPFKRKGKWVVRVRVGNFGDDEE